MRLILIFFSLFLLLGYQNCSKNQIRVTKKGKFIADNSVFSEQDPKSADEVSNEEFSEWTSTESGDTKRNYPEYFYAASTGETEGELGLNLNVIANNMDPTNEMTVDVSRVCTTIGSAKRKNMIDTNKITIKIIDIDTDEVVCSSSDTAAIRQEAIERGTITVPGCTAPLDNRNYRVEMRNADQKTLISHSTAFDNNVTKERMNLEFNVVGEKLISSGTIYVLMDYNRKKKNGPQSVPDTSCDERNSPLVIDFRKNTSELFKLTAPTNGVMFDLNGSQSENPYSPIAISWLKSSEVAFLTLPKLGRVDGIDQLFGDNTLGPDNRTAKNGFHALFKYDGLQLGYQGIKYGDRDLVIDENDDIFSLLRLWFDYNLDGRAQSNELQTLSSMGVKSIDLRYDPRYRERDQFGNEILFKSTVGMNDGSLKMIFDIWFFTGK